MAEALLYNHLLKNIGSDLVRKMYIECGLDKKLRINKIIRIVLIVEIYVIQTMIERGLYFSLLGNNRTDRRSFKSWFYLILDQRDDYDMKVKLKKLLKNYNIKWSTNGSIDIY